MNRYGVKAAACALVGTLSISGYQMTLQAKINNSSDVPAAGVAVVLDEGSTIQDLQVEVVQNIAYLESASGLQPNIVMASEKVALADASTNLIWSNAINGNVRVSTELSEPFSEVIDEAQDEGNSSSEETKIEQEDAENNGELSTEEKSDDQTTEKEPETDSQTTEKKPETDSQATEEKPETDSQATDEKAESTSGDDEYGVSAGFSATDTYEDVETELETETEEETELERETEEDGQDFSRLVIARVNNYVNVRSLPSEDGEIVGKLYDKSVGEFVEEENGWYKIVSGNCTGYVKGEYCVVGEEAEALAKEVGTTYAIVNTTTLKVRQEASTESIVLGLVPIQEELVVVEELDGWVKIAIEEGDGYVSRDYVNLRTDFVHAESKKEEDERLAREARAREEARAAAAATEASRAQRQAEAQAQRSEANQATIEVARSTAAASEGSEMGKAVIDYATQFVGNPYVWGGSSLTNGTDCSGFVMSVYKNFGVSLPHSSSALRSQGYDVGGLANAQPGDIVCYSGHVGLYVGNGQIVHASTSMTGIIVSSATYRNILAVRRIF